MISIGGGDPSSQLRDQGQHIDGNLTVLGWQGLWFGVIRNTIGGSVLLFHNKAADPSVDPGSDSTEVVTNTISGNLICLFNTPAAEVGDSEGSPNTVGGHRIGECDRL